LGYLVAELQHRWTEYRSGADARRQRWVTVDESNTCIVKKQVTNFMEEREPEMIVR
jgi:hypothetical protein